MKRISVLIPDADVQLPVARCLAASKQTLVYGFAREPAPHLRHSRFFAAVEEYHGQFNLNGWITRLSEIVVERQIDVVLPISEFAIRALSEHRRGLDFATKLPELPGLGAFDTASDKAALAGFLERRSVRHPPTIVATCGTVSRDTFSALEFPVLAKPRFSSGGVGIRRFETVTSLVAFLDEKPSGERWIVQNFVEGYDLAVNVICRSGTIVAATAQRVIQPSNEPFQPAIGVEVRDDPAAMGVAEQLVAELKWSGVANIDMRFDVRRRLPVVLELNGRYWLSLLGSLNAGINFPLLACEMCMGEPRANRRPRNARYFYGRAPVLSSLIGGGPLRIRPGETNLRYFDPIPDAIRSVKTFIAGIETRSAGTLSRSGSSF
jgi:D-aspartate ligase